MFGMGGSSSLLAGARSRWEAAGERLVGIGFRRGVEGLRPASLARLYCRHACVPVDFEEVHVSSNADEEDIRNAIMAIRRNRVALKGE